MTAPRWIEGDAPLLLIADHASALVPPGIDLGIDPALLETHIGIDIGAAALTEKLAARLGAPALLATVSRLVIDCNREPDAADVIPSASDGHVITGNLALSPSERSLRIDAIHTPYHAAIGARIASAPPRLIVSIHSFTPRLATYAAPRPWPIGILYNRDDRGARAALAWLAADGLEIGDNQPYSGRDLNYTMNRHAEANDIPYVGFEIRNDGLCDDRSIEVWADRLAAAIGAVLAR